MLLSAVITTIVLSLNLLKNFNTNDNSNDELMRIADNYKGNAKAKVFVELSNKNSNEKVA